MPVLYKKNGSRDQEIVELYRSDNRKYTHLYLGKKYKISGERVRQILSKHKTTYKHVKVTKTLCECFQCHKELHLYPSRTASKKVFCSRFCITEFWEAKRIQAKEEKRRKNTIRMQKYRQTESGKAATARAKKRYEGSEKFRKWHKKFYGYYPGEGPGNQIKNKYGKCLVKDCKRVTKCSGKNKKGIRKYYKTCSKHVLKDVKK